MSRPQPANSCSRPTAAALTTGALAHRLGGELIGRDDVTLTGINAIDPARPHELTFIAHPRYVPAFRQSRAAAAIVSRDVVAARDMNDARPLIVVPDADIAVAQALAIFSPPPALPAPGVHPSAWVSPSARMGSGVRIGPHVSIGDDAIIGDGVVLHAGVRIYDRVEIGERSEIHANAVIRERCIVGRRAIIHPNVSIGADGFGFRPALDFKSVVKIPQIGNVIIEDDVEIGAATCVDRGKFGSTIIGAGSKLDNLIQVGHNVRIGRCCVIAGCVGIGGSVIFGDWVMVGGASTFKEHLKIGDRARIGAGSMLMRDVGAGEAVLGHPADPHRQTLRQWAIVRKLPRLLERLLREPADGPQ